jgi:hypothetical protein
VEQCKTFVVQTLRSFYTFVLRSELLSPTMIVTRDNDIFTLDTYTSTSTVPLHTLSTESFIDNGEEREIHSGAC